MVKVLTAALAAFAMFSLCTKVEPTIVTSVYKDIGIRGTIHRTGGTVCGNAYVAICAKDSLPDTVRYGFKTYYRMTLTDEKGRYSFGDDLEPGIYVVYAWWNEDAALIDSVVVTQTGSDMVLPDAELRPSGAIRGKVRLAEDEGATTAYLLAFGIDRFVKTDKNGDFLMANLAEGTYSLRLIAGTEVYRPIDTAIIEVRSAETTSIGVMTLPYRDTLIPHDLKLVYDTMAQRVTLSWNMIGSKADEGFEIIRSKVIRDSVFGPETFTIDHSAGTFIDSTCLQDNRYEYCVRTIYSDTTEPYKKCTSRAKGVGITSYLTVDTVYNVSSAMDLYGLDVTPSGVMYRFLSADSSIRVLDSLMRETKSFSPGFRQDGFLQVFDDRLFIRQLDANTRMYNILRYSTEGTLLDTLVSQAGTMVCDVNYGLLTMAGISDSLSNGDSVTVMSLDGTFKLTWQYGYGVGCRAVCIADTNRIFLAIVLDSGTLLKIVEYDRSGTVIAENSITDITSFNAMAYDRRRQRLYISCDDRISFMTHGGEPDTNNRMIGMVRAYDNKFNPVAMYRVMNGNVISTMALREDGCLYLGVMGEGTAGGVLNDRLIRFNPVGR